jgi:hypothetical protein
LQHQLLHQPQLLPTMSDSSMDSFSEEEITFFRSMMNDHAQVASILASSEVDDSVLYCRGPSDSMLGLAGGLELGSSSLGIVLLHLLLQQQLLQLGFMTFAPNMPAVKCKPPMGIPPIAAAAERPGAPTRSGMPPICSTGEPEEALCVPRRPRKAALSAGERCMLSCVGLATAWMVNEVA